MISASQEALTLEIIAYYFCLCSDIIYYNLLLDNFEIWIHVNTLLEILKT
jgi:hypothetical protein